MLLDGGDGVAGGGLELGWAHQARGDLHQGLNRAHRAELCEGAGGVDLRLEIAAVEHLQQLWLGLVILQGDEGPAEGGACFAAGVGHELTQLRQQLAGAQPRDVVDDPGLQWWLHRCECELELRMEGLAELVRQR